MTQKNEPYWPGWETVRLIGRGSYGAVYEIRRNVFGSVETAALKVISIPQNRSDIEDMYGEGYDKESITCTLQNHLQNIVNEYSLMRKIGGCSNVVNCEDIRYEQHEDGLGWDVLIKMELLTPLIRSVDESFREEEVIKLGKDICKALMACREYGIVHRDIKPQNIFVSNYGDYKLGDFGIAKTVEKTMGGTKIGTYKYMAPEVYNNQPYGSAADIYSLGLVLYWLLNERRLPFMPLPPAKLTASLEEESRQRRLTGENLPVPHNGSEELKRIVLKACAFEPGDRFNSAEEMLDALNGIGVPEEEDGTIGVVPAFYRAAQPAVQKPEPAPEPVKPTVASATKKAPVVQQKPKPKGKAPLLIAIVGAALLILAILLLNPFGIRTRGEVDAPMTQLPPDVPAPAGNYLCSDELELKAGYAYLWVEEAAECPVFGSEIKRGEISTVTFMDTLKDAGEDAWDVSADADGSVLAWVKPNGAYYDLYIAADGGVNAGMACTDLFAGYINLESIRFSNCFHTDGAESMARMFFGCSKLNQIDCLRFETSDVTDMSRMFFKCSELEQLDLSSFNTASVENMFYMFWRCIGLKELDLSSFDTSSVKNMSGMFEWCVNLEQIDLSSFNTASVEELQSMFSYCLQLQKLDLSHFDTANVKNMSTMFHYCESLRELDISSFRTENVEQASRLFYSCKELKKLDVSGFDTSNMVDMGQMFSWCISLDGLDLSGFDTSSAENMREMFYCCPCVTVDQVSHFSTKKVTRYDWFMNGSDWLDLFA